MPFSLGDIYDPTTISRDEYIDNLYRRFLDELVYRPLPWKREGMAVSFRRHPEIDGRHAIFWHVISEGDGPEHTRPMHDGRCARLGWIRPLIEQFSQYFPEHKPIHWWISGTARTRHPRYMLTRGEFDYVVIVEERPSYALLITAYPIEQNHRRRKLRRDYERFWTSEGR